MGTCKVGSLNGVMGFAAGAERWVGHTSLKVPVSGEFPKRLLGFGCVLA